MHFLRGVLHIALILVVTTCVFIPLFILGIISLVLPKALANPLQVWLDVWLYWWTGFNQWLFRTFRVTRMHLSWPELDNVGTDNWYLVVCNHQSWTDIVVLQSILWSRVPPIKFFTKQELIWVPFIGLGMYVLGFPYVKRVTRADISKNPKLKNADRDAVRKACARFAMSPTTVLNFVEGTRYTPEKHARQPAKFQRLLNPKIGGLAYVVEDLGSHLHKILDITIQYPHGTPHFWDFLQGKCPEVHIHVETFDVPEEIAAARDKDVRKLLAHWIDKRWQQKDQRLLTPAHAAVD